jgi:hypothetical protein
MMELGRFDRKSQYRKPDSCFWGAFLLRLIGLAGVGDK